MTARVTQLNDVIAPAVAALGYEFVGCEYFAAGQRALLRVYIDKPQGVTVDDCALVSAQVSAVLDVEDPIPGEYNLEVSSPGIARRLFTLEQCQRFIGERVKVRMRIPVEGRRNFSGILQAVTDDKLTLQDGEDVFNLTFSNVEKMNLEVV